MEYISTKQHSRKMLSRDQILKMASVKSVIPWEKFYKVSSYSNI